MIDAVKEAMHGWVLPVIAGVLVSFLTWLVVSNQAMDTRISLVENDIEGINKVQDKRVNQFEEINDQLTCMLLISGEDLDARRDCIK